MMSHKWKVNHRRVYDHVMFESVHVREYARTVGDNPCISSGPPLMCVSRNYNAHPRLSFGFYYLILWIRSILGLHRQARLGVQF
jgi:hypothetical protein